VVNKIQDAADKMARLSNDGKPPYLSFLNRWRRFLLPPVHALLIAVAFIFSCLLRYDFSIPATVVDYLLITTPVLIAFKLVFFSYFKVHRGLWRFVTISDCLNILFAVVLGSLACQFVLFYVGHLSAAFPRSLFIIDIGMSFLLIAGLRGALRLLRERFVLLGYAKRADDVLIFGAGHSGQFIARELLARGNSPAIPVGFIDDNQSFVGSTILTLPVLGTSKELPQILASKRYKSLIVAVNSLGPEKLNQLRCTCAQNDVELRCLPLLNFLINGHVALEYTTSHIKQQDLLHREAVKVEASKLHNFYQQKVCMVSGAGGSIGSEICRQLLKYQARQVILVDHSENNLFDIDLELSRKFPHSVVKPYIADVKNETRMREIIKRHKPEIFLHAAAYKHVPLMEANPIEAFNNNVVGTRIAARLCRELGVGRFILVSTDKAVNPTSVMGLTKKLAEATVLDEATKKNGTRFSAVRFGNVLDSSGSVVPIFRQQIAQGGPITITHPEMRRFFMTIPEAVELVLCTAEMAEGGEIFVLEMGKQLKVLDLALRMIQFAGLGQNDIPIVFTGLRPGEKLFEELYSKDEIIEGTDHQKILRINQSNRGHLRLEEMVNNIASLPLGAAEQVTAVLEAELERTRRRNSLHLLAKNDPQQVDDSTSANTSPLL